MGRKLSHRVKLIPARIRWFKKYLKSIKYFDSKFKLDKIIELHKKSKDIYEAKARRVSLGKEAEYYKGMMDAYQSILDICQNS